MANQEQLSALVDNESTDASLLELLANEPERAQQWSNYHLIGDVLRGETPKKINLNIADNIALALEDEPAIVAPRPSHSSEKESSGKLVRFFKYTGQYAIAASVAVAAIVGVQQYSLQVVSDTEQPLPVFNTVPVGGSVAPVSLQSSPQPRELSEAEMIEQRKRISAYLQDHRFQQRIVEQLYNLCVLNNF